MEQTGSKVANETSEASLDSPASDLKHLEELESAEIAEALQGAPEDAADADDPSNAGHDLEKATTKASSTGRSIRRIQTAVDWDGPDDPGNPMNWPLRKRAYHTAATGVLAMAVTAGSSMISPATIEIAEHFGVSRTAAIVPLTVYVVGLGCGPIFAAPISETFGRNTVYRYSPLFFLLFLLGSALTKSYAGLVVCRLLAGMGGSPVLAVGAGTSADIYRQEKRAIATCVFVMMPFFGPGIGPIIGGFAAQYKGWRWTQYCSILLGTVAYALVLPMQETYKKVILTRRGKKLGIPGPPKPNLTTAQYLKVLITVTLLRPVYMLFTEPIVLFLSLYNSFTFAVLFAFFAAYPYVFEGVYGFNTWQYGLAFLGILIGVILAVLMALAIDRKIYYQKYFQRALTEGKRTVEPERRLYAAMIGAFGVPVGLFWFGWTARTSIHWISPVVAGIPFAWGNLAIFLSAGLYLIDVYGPLNGASALAANGLMRYVLGGVFPLFTFQMYETLGIGWASSLLGFISILLIPIPWILFRYGEKIRGRSGYDTVKT